MEDDHSNDMVDITAMMASKALFNNDKRGEKVPTSVFNVEKESLSPKALRAAELLRDQIIYFMMNLKTWQLELPGIAAWSRLTPYNQRKRPYLEVYAKLVMNWDSLDNYESAYQCVHHCLLLFPDCFSYSNNNRYAIVLKKFENGVLIPIEQPSKPILTATNDEFWVAEAESGSGSSWILKDRTPGNSNENTTMWNEDLIEEVSSSKSPATNFTSEEMIMEVPTWCSALLRTNETVRAAAVDAGNALVSLYRNNYREFRMQPLSAVLGSNVAVRGIPMSLLERTRKAFARVRTVTARSTNAALLRAIRISIAAVPSELAIVYRGKDEFVTFVSAELIEIASFSQIVSSQSTPTDSERSSLEGSPTEQRVVSNISLEMRDHLKAVLKHIQKAMGTTTKFASLDVISAVLSQRGRASCIAAKRYAKDILPPPCMVDSTHGVAEVVIHIAYEHADIFALRVLPAGTIEIGVY